MLARIAAASVLALALAACEGMPSLTYDDGGSDSATVTSVGVDPPADASAFPVDAPGNGNAGDHDAGASEDAGEPLDAGRPLDAESPEDAGADTGCKNGGNGNGSGGGNGGGMGNGCGGKG
jgi:hypothetical protein